MKFADLYPYSKTASSADFAEKDQVDALFARLESIEDNVGTLREQRDDIVRTCQKIITEQKKINAPQSPIMIAAASTVKMEIFCRLHQFEEIRKEFSEFIRVCGLTSSTTKLLNDEQEKCFKFGAILRAKTLPKILFGWLPKVLEIKSGTNPTEISVPDILAGASVVCGDNHSYNRIREVFHELWQIKNLQPLLTVAACAALGKYCNYKDEVSDKSSTSFYDGLQIIFSDKLIKDVGTMGMSCDKNVIVVCLGNEAEAETELASTYRSNASLRSTIAHELHHFWEKFTHDSDYAMPYPEAAETGDDSYAPRKIQIQAMLEEAAKITEEHSIEIEEAILCDYRHIKVRQPYQTFRNLFSCYTEEIPVRHAEIVVRVPSALASMAEPGKCSEEEALKMMREAGLGACVDFFLEEQIRMQRAIELIGIRFRDVLTLDESSKIPAYANYRPSIFHAAVRREDLATLTSLVASDKTDPTAKDSSNETALELAIRHDRPELVFAFAQSTKVLLMLSEDLNLLRRTIFYLFDYAKDETSEHREEALELFRNANKMTGGTAVSRIFSDMRAETLDKELIEKTKRITPQELLKEIADGKIPYYDNFGNNFGFYLEATERTDLVEVVREKYYLSNPRGDFIPNDTVRTALLKNNPEFFLGKTFDPTQKMEISFFYDSLIESVARRTNIKNGREWFEVFKQLIADRSTEHPHPLELFPDLLTLLPKPFREEIGSGLKERRADDGVSEEKESERVSGVVSAAGAAAVVTERREIIRG